MEVVKFGHFQIPARDKCFSLVYWRRVCLCSRFISSVPLINNVTYQHLVSIFYLASLNRLEPRCIGREDLWPTLEFLILGMPGELHANVNVQQIEQLRKQNLVVEAHLLESLDPNYRKLLEAPVREEMVSAGEEGKVTSNKSNLTL